MIKIVGLFSCVIVLLSSCGEGKSKMAIVEKEIAENTRVEKDKNDFTMPYDVNTPTMSFELSKELTEISGLTFSSTSNNLLAINDEQGIVYALDDRSGNIIDEIEFGKSDDYEGIASHDGYIYIVESNGNVKVIKEESKAKIIEFDDRLSSNNDIEGICYNPTTQTLLLAAKGDSETEGNTKHVKSIFTMNIDNGAVRRQAYIQVNIKESYNSLYPESDKDVVSKMSTSARFKKYGPSGIAIEPKTNLIYLLSSNSKSLTILDHNGTVKSIVLLDKNIHAQPEGITFDNSGNLYISNEGKSGHGMIYKYNRRN